MWIVMAWQCSASELIVKGFKKCCKSNEMGGAGDDMLWNGSEEDENVRSECEEDERIECEDQSQQQ
jgi:hypothetical protein